MKKDLVKMLTTTDSVQAGIESFVMNKQDSADVSIGDIELFVNRSDASQAD